MGIQIEQRLVKEISRALETYREILQGEVVYKEIVDRAEIFRGSQRPGLIIKAEDGSTYQIKIEPASLY
ncbi:hypothetical protein [Bacillus sp. PS06]|uniref:hypothetical protein n=1 Tax=Bacillus sp. PS06 TaxID=2764176 RepID=UPI00177D8E30|nr:hypothetical protein [Bacillus sp. PS06]MBD8067959.1 hypothetical protein [Bacillus sp. PS06]